jgi:predicted transcriptional regulator
MQVAATAPPAAGFFVGAMTFGAVFSLSWWLDKAMRTLHLRRSVRTEEFRAVAALLTLTPAEKQYCEAVSLLLELVSQLEETTARDILEELNLLLQQSRRLETHRAGIVAAMSTRASEELDRKRGELAQRAEQTKDSVARQAMQQSLHHARVLEPSLERVEAQQEVILQTQASVQASLARRKVAPAPLDAPELEEMKQSVVEVRNQTQAIEQAVQEVMALRME